MTTMLNSSLATQAKLAMRNLQLKSTNGPIVVPNLNEPLVDSDDNQLNDHSPNATMDFTGINEAEDSPRTPGSVRSTHKFTHNDIPTETE